MTILYQYVALTGNLENIGITQDMYDELKVKDKKHLDEGDRLQGEDMMTYLNRKNEA